MGRQTQVDMFKRFYTILLVSYGPRPLRNAHELCPLKQVANYSPKTEGNCSIYLY